MTKSKPFHEFHFDSTIVKEKELIDWWKSQTVGNNDESVLGMTQQLVIQCTIFCMRRKNNSHNVTVYFLFSKLKQNAQFKVKFAY